MPPEHDEAGVAIGARRVWVADRSFAVASAFGEVLNSVGWASRAFDAAAGLSSALEAAGPSELPGLLLLDLHLPRGGAGEEARPPRSMSDEPLGFELLPELRLAYPTLAIVLLVEFARLETAVKAVRLGAGDVLVKPVPDDRLQRVADEAVSRQALLMPSDEADAELPGEAGDAAVLEQVTQPTPDHADTGTVLPLSEAMASVERDLIRHALDAHDWARTATADALGINRATLYKKMRAHGLDQPGQDWPQSND